ncbi:MAG: hypothetical protein HY298_12615 [Verrucomicrobia bacterium]|nr:hypothetical protein [Verrucomicrobiota bacterium]
MKSKTLYYGVLLALLAASLGQAQAQVPGAIDQVDSVQQRRTAQQSAQAGATQEETAPELYPGETDDVGPQSIVQLRPRKTLFEVVADIQYFYTDNMFLEEGSGRRLDTGVLVSTVEVALAPSPYEMFGGMFAPRLGYRHQWYDFGLDGNKVEPFGIPLDRFDFNAQTVFVEEQYRCCENWIAEVGVDATRLMSQSDYREFYKELVPHWGLRQLFPFCETTVLSLGYEGTYRFTSADAVAASDLNDRTDHILLASCTHFVTPKLIAQPYYRFKYTHFTGGVPREDFLNSVGLTLQYAFTRQFSARVFVDYSLKESSNPAVPDYRKLDAGAGLNLSLRF